MTSFVTSADGTRIAYDRLGRGPALILVSGMFCDRDITAELALALAERFTVHNYDRRGRGESTEVLPYDVQRELEDLRALIVKAGGTAMVYGHSSGAGLALRAAAAGLPITRLVLHEPPYGGDDEESREGSRRLAEGVRDAIRAGHGDEAVRLFFETSGLPPELVDELSADPKRRALAHTMVYDLAVMGDFEGGGVPEDLVRAIRVPTLVLAGSDSPDFFRVATARVAEHLPNGRLAILKDADHGAGAEIVAPTVAAFLSA